MKRGRNQEKDLSKPIKKERRGQKAGHAQTEPRQGAAGMPAPAAHPRNFHQARGAQEAFVVLGDAFAAEEVPAFGALRDRFPGGVIQAMLVGQGKHGVRSFARAGLRIWAVDVLPAPL